MPGESSEKTSEPQQSERLGRVRDLGARDARHLTKRFARDAHSASDAVIDVATARAVIARDNVRWGRIVAKKLMSVRHNRRYTAILLQAPKSADLTSVRPPTFTRMETTSVIRIKRPWRGWICAETVFLK